MWVINQHFVQPNLVLKDIHQDQHTCPGQFQEPREWPRGLDLPAVCSPLICKLVSMKVTVCGNENHMRWWLLSVKIADMACVARRNVKLRAGRRTLCEGRKKVVSEARDRSPPDRRRCQGLGHEAWGLLKARDICMKYWPSPAWFSALSHPVERGQGRRGTELRLSTHTDGVYWARILSYPNIPIDAGAWRKYAWR